MYLGSLPQKSAWRTRSWGVLRSALPANRSRSGSSWGSSHGRCGASAVGCAKAVPAGHMLARRRGDGRAAAAYACDRLVRRPGCQSCPNTALPRMHSHACKRCRLMQTLAPVQSACTQLARCLLSNMQLLLDCKLPPARHLTVSLSCQHCMRCRLDTRTPHQY